MMTLDAALVILMAEALGVLILLSIGLILISRKKRNKEMQAIDSFINQLNAQTSHKNQPLHQLLSETCELDQQTVENTLKEISSSERALMQKFIKLFLQREMSLLSEIDQGISTLTDPYCRLLSHRPTNTKTTLISAEQGLERINQQLVHQLDTAMKTIDEITAEYTRVFSGNQSALELENSRKKMLQIFQDSEHNILHPDK